MDKKGGKQRFKKRKFAEKHTTSSKEEEEQDDQQVSDLPDKIEPQTTDIIRLPPSSKEGEKGDFLLVLFVID